MQTTRRLTKEEERAVMQMIAERRQKDTPEHKDPAWVAAYYKRVSS